MIQSGKSLLWNTKVGLHKDVRWDKKSGPLNRGEGPADPMIQVDPQQTSSCNPPYLDK